MENRLNGLTRRQFEARQAIEKFVSEHGIAPSYKEIGAALGVSPESANKLVDCLERRGHISRKRGQARSLVLIPMAA